MRYEFRTHARISYRETKQFILFLYPDSDSSSSPARHSNIRLTCNPRLAWFVCQYLARTMTGRIIRSKRLLGCYYSFILIKFNVISFWVNGSISIFFITSIGLFFRIFNCNCSACLAVITSSIVI